MAKSRQAALQRVQLMFFLSVSRAGLQVERRIEQVWESDGQSPHRKVFDADTAWKLPETSYLVSDEQFNRARQTIDELPASQSRTIEQVRAYLLQTIKPH